jgi:hypothetical protein
MMPRGASAHKLLVAVCIIENGNRNRYATTVDAASTHGTPRPGHLILREPILARPKA